MTNACRAARHSHGYADSQNDFKPVVERWGEKGILQCSAILEHAKATAVDADQAQASEDAAAPTGEEDEDLEDVLDIKEDPDDKLILAAAVAGLAD